MRGLRTSRLAAAHFSARRHSTIDTVIRAGQELPAIRHEQRDDLSDVLGGADATQRNIPEPISTGKSGIRRRSERRVDRIREADRGEEVEREVVMPLLVGDRP